MVQHLRWEPNSFCSSVPQWSCPAQVCCWQQTMDPSGMSPFWLGSCNNSFLRIVPTQVRWQLWQPFPQDCSHSGLVAFVLALPSRLFPLWHGGSSSFRTVPTLAAVPSGGSHSFCVEGTYCNSCSLLKYGVLYTSLVSNFDMNWLFSSGSLCSRVSWKPMWHGTLSPATSAVPCSLVSAAHASCKPLGGPRPHCQRNTRTRPFPPRLNPCLLICNATRRKQKKNQHNC